MEFLNKLVRYFVRQLVALGLMAVAPAIYLVIPVFQGASAGQCECPHSWTTAHRSQGRAERPMPVRFGEEVQAVLQRATVN